MCIYPSAHLSSFVKKILSDLLNLSYPKLVWWCIIVSQSVIKKPTHIGVIGLLSKYSLVMYHQEPECLGKRFCYQGQGHSEGKTWLFELLYLQCC